MRLLTAIVFASVAVTTVRAQTLSFIDQPSPSPYKPTSTSRTPGCQPYVRNYPGQVLSIAKAPLGNTPYPLSSIELSRDYRQCERLGCDIYVFDSAALLTRPHVHLDLETHGQNIFLGPFVNGRREIIVDHTQYWWSGNGYVCQ
jgi:hypothetical protein